ncbi:MAG: DUF4393 domain-containing protein [Pseudomonadota bacterium]
MDDENRELRSRSGGDKSHFRHRPASQTSPSQAETLPNTLSTVSAKIWGLAQVKSYTIEMVEEVLEARKVPKHRVVSPSLEITVPAIEAMRYSPLRREIAALIASTMDRDNAEMAHPSFLSILQQLTEDEVKILGAFPDVGRVLPVANLWMSTSIDHAEVLHRNIMPKSIAKICSHKSRLPLYIDNLVRLKLLHEPEGVKIGDARIYSNLLRQGFCARMLENPRVRKHSTLEKHTIALSDAGNTFRRACLI